MVQGSIISEKVSVDYLQVGDIQHWGKGDTSPGGLVRQEAVAQWVEAGVNRPPSCAIEREGRNQGSTEERAGATTAPNWRARHLHGHLQGKADRLINTHTYVSLWYLIRYVIFRHTCMTKP
jgi:hypothetical protein